MDGVKPVGDRFEQALTRFRRPVPPSVTRQWPRPCSIKKDSMPDLAYLALTVVCFIVLGLIVKAVEKL